MNLLKLLDTPASMILAIATCAVGLFVTGCISPHADVEVAACSRCGKIVGNNSPYAAEYLDARRAGKRWYCPDCKNRGKTGAVSAASVSPPFQVGDLTERWRHTNDGHDFETGPDSDKKGTVWKILKITDDYVEMELVSGRYQWGFDREAYKVPGYITQFDSSDNYRAANRGCKGNEQILREWRKLGGMKP